MEPPDFQKQQESSEGEQRVVVTRGQTAWSIEMRGVASQVWGKVGSATDFLPIVSLGKGK